MKKFFLSLVISSTLLLMSCDKNSTANPVSPDSISKNAIPTSTAADNTIQGSIPLNRSLVVPGINNTEFHLLGTINYTDEAVKPDPRMAPSGYDFKIALSINAALNSSEIGFSGNVKNRWDISSESEDLVFVSPEGIQILKKTYPVIGSIDEMKLVCTFIVTTNGIGLNDVALKVPNDTNGGG